MNSAQLPKNGMHSAAASKVPYDSKVGNGSLGPDKENKSPQAANKLLVSSSNEKVVIKAAQPRRTSCYRVAILSLPPSSTATVLRPLQTRSPAMNNVNLVLSATSAMCVATTSVEEEKRTAKYAVSVLTFSSPSSPQLFKRPNHLSGVVEEKYGCYSAKFSEGCHSVELRKPRGDIKKIVFWDLDETLLYTGLLFEYLHKMQDKISADTMKKDVVNFIINLKEVQKLLQLGSGHTENILVTARKKDDPSWPESALSILTAIGLDHFYKIVFTDGTFKHPVMIREHEALLGNVPRGNSMIVEDNSNYFKPCSDAGFDVAIVEPGDDSSHLNDVKAFVTSPQVMPKVKAIL